MLWLNVEHADGTETDYATACEQGMTYTRRDQAMEAATRRCAETGCDVHVIDDGSVIASLRAIGPPDEQGLCQVSSAETR